MGSNTGILITLAGAIVGCLTATLTMASHQNAHPNAPFKTSFISTGDFEVRRPDTPFATIPLASLYSERQGALEAQFAGSELEFEPAKMHQARVDDGAGAGAFPGAESRHAGSQEAPAVVFVEVSGLAGGGQTDSKQSAAASDAQIDDLFAAQSAELGSKLDRTPTIAGKNVSAANLQAPTTTTMSSDVRVEPVAATTVAVRQDAPTTTTTTTLAPTTTTASSTTTTPAPTTTTTLLTANTSPETQAPLKSITTTQTVVAETTTAAAVIVTSSTSSPPVPLQPTDATANEAVPTTTMAPPVTTATTTTERGSTDAPLASTTTAPTTTTTSTTTTTTAAPHLRIFGAREAKRIGDASTNNATVARTTICSNADGVPISCASGGQRFTVAKVPVFEPSSSTLKINGSSAASQQQVVNEFVFVPAEAPLEFEHETYSETPANSGDELPAEHRTVDDDDDTRLSNGNVGVGVSADVSAGAGVGDDLELDYAVGSSDTDQHRQPPHPSVYVATTATTTTVPSVTSVSVKVSPIRSTLAQAPLPKQASLTSSTTTTSTTTTTTTTTPAPSTTRAAATTTSTTGVAPHRASSRLNQKLMRLAAVDDLRKNQQQHQHQRHNRGPPAKLTSGDLRRRQQPTTAINIDAEETEFLRRLPMVSQLTRLSAASKLSGDKPALVVKSTPSPATVKRFVEPSVQRAFKESAATAVESKYRGAGDEPAIARHKRPAASLSQPQQNPPVAPTTPSVLPTRAGQKPQHSSRLMSQTTVAQTTQTVAPHQRLLDDAIAASDFETRSKLQTEIMTLIANTLASVGGSPTVANAAQQQQQPANKSDDSPLLASESARKPRQSPSSPPTVVNATTITESPTQTANQTVTIATTTTNVTTADTTTTIAKATTTATTTTIMPSVARPSTAQIRLSSAQPSQLQLQVAAHDAAAVKLDEYEGSVEDQLARDALHNAQPQPQQQAVVATLMKNTYTASSRRKVDAKAQQRQKPSRSSKKRRLEQLKLLAVNSGQWIPAAQGADGSYDASQDGNDSAASAGVVSASTSSSDSAANLMPGRPGIDYPIYSHIPKTSFDCNNYQQGGFYADVETDCQVYHSCHKGRGGWHSFLCSNGTVFSQELLTCDWWYNVECSSSKLFAGPQQHHQASGSSFAASNADADDAITGGHGFRFKL